MIVFSASDGIGTGRHVLNMLNIPVEKYYSSEIDKYAISVSMDNYPDIVQVGNLYDVKGSDYSDVELLIGGTPCRQLSNVNKHSNIGIYGKDSKLFFEFVRVLKEISPKYFFFENVMMSDENKSTISHILGCKPVMVDASWISPQSRKRLYWTNIPFTGIPTKKTAKNFIIKDILQHDKCSIMETNHQREYLAMLNKSHLTDIIRRHLSSKRDIVNQINPVIEWGKQPRNQHRVYSIFGKCGCLTKSQGTNTMIFDNGSVRLLTQNELELMQGFPIGYTSTVSRSKAASLLGDAWHVGVVSEFFKGLL